MLTTDYGWAGWATSSFDLGITAHVANTEALSAALESAFQKSATYHRTPKGDRFCRFHTLANWKAHWVAGIARDCGIAVGNLAEQVSWDWAMEGVDRKHNDSKSN